MQYVTHLKFLKQPNLILLILEYKTAAIKILLYFIYFNFETNLIYEKIHNSTILSSSYIIYYVSI